MASTCAPSTVRNDPVSGSLDGCAHLISNTKDPPSFSHRLQPFSSRNPLDVRMEPGAVLESALNLSRMDRNFWCRGGEQDLTDSRVGIWQSIRTPQELHRFVTALEFIDALRLCGSVRLLHLRDVGASMLKTGFVPMERRFEKPEEGVPLRDGRRAVIDRAFLNSAAQTYRSIELSCQEWARKFPPPELRLPPAGKNNRSSVNNGLGLSQVRIYEAALALAVMPDKHFADFLRSAPEVGFGSVFPPSLHQLFTSREIEIFTDRQFGRAWLLRKGLEPGGISKHPMGSVGALSPADQIFVSRLGAAVLKNLLAAGKETVALLHAKGREVVSHGCPATELRETDRETPLHSIPYGDGQGLLTIDPQVLDKLAQAHHESWRARREESCMLADPRLHQSSRAISAGGDGAHVPWAELPERLKNRDRLNIFGLAYMLFTLDDGSAGCLYARLLKAAAD